MLVRPNADSIQMGFDGVSPYRQQEASLRRISPKDDSGKASTRRAGFRASRHADGWPGGRIPNNWA